MIKGLGTGTQITQSQIPELETPKPQTNQPTQSGQTIPVPQLNQNVTGTSTSLKAEQQMAGSIQQALLNNLFEQAKLSPSINSEGSSFQFDFIPKPKPPADSGVPEEIPPAIEEPEVTEGELVANEEPEVIEEPPVYEEQDVENPAVEDQDVEVQNVEDGDLDGDGIRNEE